MELSNFLNGIPQFAISIGYEENNEIQKWFNL